MSQFKKYFVIVNITTQLGGQLRFDQLRQENEGVYLCLIETRLGTVSKEFVVKVNGLSINDVTQF